MRSVSTLSRNSARGWSLSFSMTMMLCVAAGMLISLPGCGGCFRDDTAKKDEKEKKDKKKVKKPKPDFEIQQLVVEPFDDSVNKHLVKHGHWVTATQTMRANNFDFQAEIHSQTVAKYNQPIDIEHTLYQMVSSRTGALPKGQTKNFETIYFVPRSLGRQKKTVWLRSRLLARRSGREVKDQSQPTIAMPDYQFSFVVLSSAGSDYNYLKRLDSLKPPTGDDDFDRIQYYREILPKIAEGQVPLPSHPLTWTTIAYVLWDDLSPDLLSPDQKTAMVDWLHWGGQIIVNGPGSLDKLKGSFLADYLPAQASQSISLDQDAFGELNKGWSLPESNNDNQPKPIEINPEKPLLGVNLELEDDGQFLPTTGELVVERRVGRGRIVATAFNLKDERIINWGGLSGNFDSFFNACLLRRPSRRYSQSPELLGPRVHWNDFTGLTKDARLLSTLRYFTRDMGITAFSRDSRRQMPVSLPDAMDESMSFEADSMPAVLDQIAVEEPRAEKPASLPKKLAHHDTWHFGGFQREQLSGVAGWNDTNGTAGAARKSLQDAAGINVPKASFVLKALAIYITFLVPINWGFFRLIGRVEWAWLAAPVIAVLGAVGVIRFAQLDIGFVRSQTEIAILEVHSGYDRAHLTRYTALYTSLSATYSFEFENESTLAQPFSTDTTKRRELHDPVNHVHFHRDNGVSLRGFKVGSNTTGMIHSEEIYELGGGFQLVGNEQTGFQIRNDSDLTLKEVGILSRRGDKYLTAWIDTLQPKAAVKIDLAPAAENRPFLPQWSRSDTMKLTGGVAEGEVNVGRLVELATRKLLLGDGEVRLVGWSEQKMPGVSIYPDSSQKTYRTFVLAHLRLGGLPPATPDANSRADFMRDTDVKAEDENENEVPTRDIGTGL